MTRGCYSSDLSWVAQCRQVRRSAGAREYSDRYLCVPTLDVDRWKRVLGGPRLPGVSVDLPLKGVGVVRVKISLLVSHLVWSGPRHSGRVQQFKTRLSRGGLIPRVSGVATPHPTPHTKVSLLCRSCPFRYLCFTSSRQRSPTPNPLTPP